MAFSPVKASKEIAFEYSRYLSSIFSLSDPVYQQQFAASLRDMPFSAGPYLEVNMIGIQSISMTPFFLLLRLYQIMKDDARSISST